MNRSEHVNSIVAGLIKVRSELLNMEADKTGQRGKYIGRDQLLREVNTVLAPAGMQIITRDYIHEQYGLVMRVELHHGESEQWMASDYTIENHLDFTQGDVNWKKGGAITYGLRYTIGAMLGISIGDDDYKPEDHAPQAKPTTYTSTYSKPTSELGGPNLKPLWSLIYKNQDKSVQQSQIASIKKRYNVKDLALLTQEQVNEIVNGTNQSNQMDLEEIF